MCECGGRGHWCVGGLGRGISSQSPLETFLMSPEEKLIIPFFFFFFPHASVLCTEFCHGLGLSLSLNKSILVILVIWKFIEGKVSDKYLSHESFFFVKQVNEFSEKHTLKKKKDFLKLKPTNQPEFTKCSANSSKKSIG